MATTPGHIFISYAREDRERVKRLAEALERAGWPVWWDRRIIAGQEFDRVIEEALEAAGCVVVVWSPHSVQSEWVKNEAEVGAERRVLLPVLLDPVKLPLQFRRRQTVSLVGWEGDETHPGFQDLCEGIRAVLSGRQTPGQQQDTGPALSPVPLPGGRVPRWVWYAAVLLAGLAGAAVIFLPGWDIGLFNPPHAGSEANRPLPVQITTPSGSLAHGVFTPKGYVLAPEHGLGNRQGLRIRWVEDGVEKQSAVEIVKSGSFAREVILLRPLDSPMQPRPFSIRLASSLRPGEPVERYLGPTDRTPGTVKEVFAAREVWGEGDQPLRLRNLLITTRIAGPGDSGAPVLDSEGRLVGLLFGASREETISLMIDDVKVSFPEAF